ncbi:hypothetical protein cyc_07954 [Cyclospora cayetanensis]|uniref:Uncharacterized protein n=1 Tax=Cyclospora cayetanensis TaxID=88456 RepID=A0A1D3D2N2_9EIME|nr:hypothetical protein cyc_07954 [Cyclospora cayetanensis]
MAGSQDLAYIRDKLPLLDLQLPHSIFLEPLCIQALHARGMFTTMGCMTSINSQDVFARGALERILLALLDQGLPSHLHKIMDSVVLRQSRDSHASAQGAWFCFPVDGSYLFAVSSLHQSMMPHDLMLETEMYAWFVGIVHMGPLETTQPMSGRGGLPTAGTLHGVRSSERHLSTLDSVQNEPLRFGRGYLAHPWWLWKDLLFAAALSAKAREKEKGERKLARLFDSGCAMSTKSPEVSAHPSNTLHDESQQPKASRDSLEADQQRHHHGHRSQEALPSNRQEQELQPRVGELQRHTAGLLDKQQQQLEGEQRENKQPVCGREERKHETGPNGGQEQAQPVRSKDKDNRGDASVILRRPSSNTNSSISCARRQGARAASRKAAAAIGEAAQRKRVSQATKQNRTGNPSEPPSTSEAEGGNAAITAPADDVCLIKAIICTNQPEQQQQQQQQQSGRKRRQQTPPGLLVRLHPPANIEDAYTGAAPRTTASPVTDAPPAASGRKRGRGRRTGSTGKPGDAAGVGDGITSSRRPTTAKGAAEAFSASAASAVDEKHAREAAEATAAGSDRARAVGGIPPAVILETPLPVAGVATAVAAASPIAATSPTQGKQAVEKAPSAAPKAEAHLEEVSPRQTQHRSGFSLWAFAKSCCSSLLSAPSAAQGGAAADETPAVAASTAAPAAVEAASSSWYLLRLQSSTAAEAVATPQRPLRRVKDSTASWSASSKAAVRALRAETAPFSEATSPPAAANEHSTSPQDSPNAETSASTAARASTTTSARLPPAANAEGANLAAPGQERSDPDAAAFAASAAIVPSAEAQPAATAPTAEAPAATPSFSAAPPPLTDFSAIEAEAASAAKAAWIAAGETDCVGSWSLLLSRAFTSLFSDPLKQLLFVQQQKPHQIREALSRLRRQRVRNRVHLQQLQQTEQGLHRQQQPLLLQQQRRLQTVSEGLSFLDSFLSAALRCAEQGISCRCPSEACSRRGQKQRERLQEKGELYNAEPHKETTQQQACTPVQHPLRQHTKKLLQQHTQAQLEGAEERQGQQQEECDHGLQRHAEHQQQLPEETSDSQQHVGHDPKGAEDEEHLQAGEQCEGTEKQAEQEEKQGENQQDADSEVFMDSLSPRGSTRKTTEVAVDLVDVSSDDDSRSGRCASERESACGLVLPPDKLAAAAKNMASERTVPAGDVATHFAAARVGVTPSGGRPLSPADRFYSAADLPLSLPAATCTIPPFPACGGTRHSEPPLTQVEKKRPTTPTPQCTSPTASQQQSGRQRCTATAPQIRAALMRSNDRLSVFERLLAMEAVTLADIEQSLKGESTSPCQSTGTAGFSAEGLCDGRKTLETTSEGPPGGPQRVPAFEAWRQQSKP